jgi:GTP-binding protein HflX
MAQVNRVLAEIGAADIPQILVYNKIDRLHAAPRIERDSETHACAVWISAVERTGLDLLGQAIAEHLARGTRYARVRIPAAAGALRSRLYSSGAVRGECSLEDGSIDLAVELPDTELLALARARGVQILELQCTDAPCTAAEAYLQSAVAASAAKLS